MSTVLLRSHTDTAGSGGLTVGLHIVDLADLSDYEDFILAGEMTFALPINQWEGLNAELNTQLYNVYILADGLSAGGLTIGDAVTGGGANRILYEDGSQNLAANANFIFNGTDIALGHSSPSAKLHVIKTTEQLRIGYDASNYFKTTVGATGLTTLDAAGSSSGFRFDDPIGVETNPASTHLAVLGAASTGVNRNGLHIGISCNSGYSLLELRTLYGVGPGQGNFITCLNDATTSFSVSSEGRVFSLKPANFGVAGVGENANGNYFGHSPNTGYYSTRVETAYGIADGQGDVFQVVSSGTVWATFTSGAKFGLGLSSTPSAKFHLISTTEQMRLGYDASNYFKTTVGSTGGVTFDAVGSGAGFTFSDDILSNGIFRSLDAVRIGGSTNYANLQFVSDTELRLTGSGTMALFRCYFDLQLEDGVDMPLGTTNGTKIGTATNQKLGFFDATPVTQRSNIGALTDNSTGAAGDEIKQTSDSIADDNFARVTARINAIEQILQDLGLTN